MSFTPNYNLEIPARGTYEGTWDVPINLNFQKIDEVLAKIATANKSYSMPSGHAVGSLWFDLNWNILKIKKRSTNNPSDYVRLIDEENVGDIIGSSFVERETLSPPVPTNVFLTSNIQEDNGVTYSFSAGWDNISGTYADFDSYIIRLTGTNIGNTTVLEYQTKANSFTFTGLEVGTSWNVKVLTVSKQRQSSAWCAAIPRDISQDTTAPPVPTDVIITAGLSDAFITWTESNANDLAGYEVHAKTIIGAPASGDNSNRVAIVSKTSALVRVVPNTTYYFYVRAFDRTGNKSGFSTVATGTTSSTLSSIGGNSGEIELGSVTILGNSSYIRSGQASFNTGQGFWLGMISGVPKFSIGNSAGNRFVWDGTSLLIVGDITLGNSNSIKSGQTAYNTGTGFYIGRDSSGNTKLSLGNSSGSNLTYDQTTGELNVKGQITIGQGSSGYNAISDKPSSTAQTIVIKRNYINFTSQENGEAYIHGYDSNGIAADVDGKVYHGGILINIPKSPVLTSIQNVTGYILVDTSFSNRFTISGSPVSIVFAQKVSGATWRYDNNASAWTTFTINNNDIIIGKIVTDQNVGDNIASAEVWQYAVLPDTTAGSGSIIGNMFGTGFLPPPLLTTPPINGTGLFANDTKMGFISNGSWKTYFDNAGKFYVAGDGINNGIDWNVTTPNVLTVKGVINITSGTGYTNLSDRPADEEILNTYASYNVLSIPSDAELFSFSKNITGSRGTAPTGTVNVYTRRTGEGKFGFDCIEITGGQIVYGGLETKIDWDKFSFLCWIKREAVDANYRAFFGAWERASFVLYNSALVYSFTNTTPQEITSALTISDTNWHLVGVSVDKLNNKVTFFKDNIYEEKTVTINYTSAATAFTLGQVAAGNTNAPANMQFDNMVIFKNTAIDSTYAAAVYVAQKPFFDQNPIKVAAPPTNPIMTIIEDYTETEYAIDGYTYDIG